MAPKASNIYHLDLSRKHLSTSDLKERFPLLLGAGISSQGLCLGHGSLPASLTVTRDAGGSGWPAFVMCLPLCWGLQQAEHLD